MKNNSILLTLLFVFFILIVNYGGTFWQTDFTQSIIKSKLENNSKSLLIIDSDTLYAQSQLKLFYQYCDYHLIWTNNTVQSKKINELIEIIEQSDEEGLNPMDYHLVKIKNLQKKIYPINKKEVFNTARLADLDILISDAFLTLALHYYAGKIQNSKLNRDFKKFYNDINLYDFHLMIMQTDHLNQIFYALRPPHQEYHQLQKALVQYKKKAKLYPDSLLLQQNITKISINMERWRWLPKTIDSLFIIVNIPAFRLMLYQNNKIIMEMKTIVGKPRTPTPAFNANISYIVIRPNWNIPSSIIRNEILPKVQKDASYLSKNNMKIYANRNNSDTKSIPPSSIEWEAISINNFPYKLMQTPGSGNALGNVKLMFPNQFNVYLHDTPTRKLFDKDVRSFSHGCIRLEKAKELAAYLMQNDTLLLSENYEKYFRKNERRNLPEKIPLAINYWTVWPENSDIIIFEDIYKKDFALEKAMKKKPLRF